MNSIEKKTGFIKSFDGTPIYYEVRGEGPPIVFAYGLACLINHWVHQIKYLSRGYQTIVFDYRGHHKTPAPQDFENLTLDGLAKDIRELLRHLHVERAHFCGHSFGGQVLLKTYEQFPSLFRSLILVNAFAEDPIKNMFGSDHVSKFYQYFRATYSAYPGLLNSAWRLAFDNPIAIHLASLAGGFNLKLASLKDVEIYARGVSAMDPDIFIRWFDQMTNYNGSKTLETVNVPSLIISGTKDGVTPVDYQLAIHNKIKGSQHAIVPLGSHCTQLDMPEFVNLRIEKFINEVEKANHPGQPFNSLPT